MDPEHSNVFHRSIASLAPIIHAHADESEFARTLAPPIVTAFVEHGVFAMLTPRAYGGGEVNLTDALAALEALARSDGAAAWCAMVAATSGVLLAYMDPSAARSIAGDRARNVLGGVFAPIGRAEQTPGGYLLSGRWPFFSGSMHCAWLAGGAVITDGGVPRMSASGVPETRMFFFPREACAIHDTWDVAGLRGTGSHDVSVREIVVPHEHSVALGLDRPRETGPLYAFPVFGLLALGVASVALGIARHALDAIAELAVTKTPLGGRGSLAKRSVVQSDFARAEGELSSARAFLHSTVSEAWKRAERIDAFTSEHRAHLRLAATHAAHAAQHVTATAYEIGGGTAIYARSPSQRCFRDVHVATHHVMVAKASYELIGRVLLGVEADTALL